MSATDQHPPPPAPQAPKTSGPIAANLPAQPTMAALNSKTGRKSRRWWWLLALLVVIALVAWWFSRHVSTVPPWLTEKVGRGTIEASISATGTLQPLKSVDVGSELSGTITALYANDNDTVKTGQILAKLDTAKLNDSVQRAEATLRANQAAVSQAHANLQDANMQLKRLREAHRLSGGQVPAQIELDNAVSAQKRMQAALIMAESNVQQARSALQSERTNLEKAVIRSPINGVVLARKVEVGQTVAASLSTPTLFSIAQDLAQMELGIQIDEADVSQVRAGMPVHFTVPAFGAKQFPATLKRVTLGSTLTDNVVTYKAVLDVNNSDYALRPGMTATARIITASTPNALTVSNAALRFDFQAAMQKAMAAQAGGGGNAKKGSSPFIMSGPRRPPREKRVQENPTNEGADNTGMRPGKLWIVQNGQPTQIDVLVGASDGKNSAVRSAQLQEGSEVINDLRNLSSAPTP